MPTYVYTAPNGARVKVTGDGEPTDAELEQIFRQQGLLDAPTAPSQPEGWGSWMARTAKDVALGAAKEPVATAHHLLDRTLTPIALALGGSPEGVTAGQKATALLAPTNTAQRVGGVLGSLAEGAVGNAAITAPLTGLLARQGPAVLQAAGLGEKASAFLPTFAGNVAGGGAVAALTGGSPTVGAALGAIPGVTQGRQAVALRSPDAVRFAADTLKNKAIDQVVSAINPAGGPTSQEMAKDVAPFVLNHPELAHNNFAEMKAAVGQMKDKMGAQAAQVMTEKGDLPVTAAAALKGIDDQIAKLQVPIQKQGAIKLPAGTTDLSNPYHQPLLDELHRLRAKIVDVMGGEQGSAPGSVVDTMRHNFFDTAEQAKGFHVGGMSTPQISAEGRAALTAGRSTRAAINSVMDGIEDPRLKQAALIDLERVLEHGRPQGPGAPAFAGATGAAAGIGAKMLGFPGSFVGSMILGRQVGNAIGLASHSPGRAISNAQADWEMAKLIESGARPMLRGWLQKYGAVALPRLAASHGDTTDGQP